MGEFLKANVRAAWKKVGSFKLIQKVTPNGGTPCGVEKVGGNVVTYFCTPEMEVIHAIPGNVSAETFLKEAKWAVALAGQQAEKVAAAQQERLSGYRNRVASPMDLTHATLSKDPLPQLDDVYRFFFETIVRETISDDPIVLTESDDIYGW